jgi:hypothetical protein
MTTPKEFVEDARIYLEDKIGTEIQRFEFDHGFTLYRATVYLKDNKPHVVLNFEVNLLDD